MKRFSRRSFIKATGFTLAAASLAACSPSQTPTPAAAGDAAAADATAPAGAPTSAPAAAATQPASAPQSAAGVELRFGCWDSDSGQEVYNAITEGFSKVAPDINVKIEYTPDNFEDKILTGLAGGNAPDVYMWWNFPGLFAKNGMVDLTNLAGLSGDAGLDLSAVYPTVLNYSKINGKLIGTPNAFTPRALYYNKKLFRDAGVAEPTEDWTTEDMLNAMLAIAKGEGENQIFGFYSDPSSYWLQPYVWENGGDFISEDGTKASGFVDSKETIETVQWFADLVTKHKIAPTPDTGKTLGGSTQLFLNGKLALMDNGRWPQTDFKKKEDLEFGLIIPAMNAATKKRISILHTSAFCINPATKNQEAAWKFAKYIGGPEGNKQFGLAGWAVPAYPAVIKELGWESDPLEKVWIDTIQYATVTPCFMRTTAWDQADTELANALESIWLGQATAEEALKQVAPVMDGILASADKI